MKGVNTLMDDLEQDVKVITVNGETKTIREVLDSILKKDEKEKRQFSEG